LTLAIQENAVARVEAGGIENLAAIVLRGDDPNAPEWHHGVLGIVCSRLVERYGVPAFLFGFDKKSGRWKGSGRAPSHVEGVDLYEILKACEPYLDRFGGHAAAAGATMKEVSDEEFAEFACAFADAAAGQMTPEERIPTVFASLDQVRFDDLTPSAYGMLKRFAPFGHGNERIQMIARDVTVTSARVVGEKKVTVRLALEQGGTKFTGISFGLLEQRPEVVQLQTPFVADVVFSFEENTWNGEVSLQLKVRDLQPRSGQPLQDAAAASQRDRGHSSYKPAVAGPDGSAGSPYSPRRLFAS
jgi:single-stranded-DNA-specific exonuclease